MKEEAVDIAIIGGGPAGSSAAIRLAAAGRKVLLIDKARFPRHKLCGEFVSPECLETFCELGVEHGVSALDTPRLTKTVFYSVSGRSLAVRNSLLDRNGRHSIGLSRAAMDELLIERARSLGVDVRLDTSFRSARTENGSLTGVELRTGDGHAYLIRAKLAVDASGRGRILSRSLQRSVSPKATLVAFKSHLRNASIEKGSCEIYSYPAGYGGCLEIENGLFNLCFIAKADAVKEIGSDPDEAVCRLLMQNRQAEKVLDRSQFIGDWYAVPIASFGRASLVPHPGVLSIGDAAAFIDPFTGSGIALALESSKLLAHAILSNTEFEEIANAFERSYRAAFHRRLQFCKVLRLASTKPWAASATIALLGSSAYLTRIFARATRFNSLRSSA